MFLSSQFRTDSILMKTTHALAALLGTAASAAFLPAHAQDRAFDERFTLRLSAFNPDASLNFHTDGTVVEGSNTVTFDDRAELGVGSRWRPRGAFAYRMTERQALVGDFYDYARTNSVTYDGRTFDPNDYFDPGDFDLPDDPIQTPTVSLDARLDFNLASLNYHYAFVRTDTFTFGAGAGLTYAELEARGSGSSSATNALDSEYVEASWKRSGLTPGVHAILGWAPMPRLRFSLAAQYMDADWGNFLDESGHFERAGLIAEYLVTDRVGIHVGYDWFRLKLSDDYRGSFGSANEVGIDRVDYSGRLTGELKVHGPLAGVTFHF